MIQSHHELSPSALSYGWIEVTSYYGDIGATSRRVEHVTVGLHKVIAIHFS